MTAPVLCALLFPLLLTASLPANPSQPNLILMMADDHGWEETGFNGHPHVKTPVLDEMATTGLKFERFYAAHPSCSPTRASFLTGRHPNRMGTFAPGWSFRPEEFTIAHLLSQAGYHCVHLGKWHVGAVKKESPVCPGAMGFHEWLSHDNFFELNPTLSRNGSTPERFQGESSAILIRESIEALKRARDAGQPCLQVIWFGSPHEPYSGLPEDLALYHDLPARYPEPVKVTSNETGATVQRPRGQILRERYAEITALDRAIGTLRSFLAESGLRQNTLLFYCGDNGTSPESALGFPHRGAKGEVYEGGTLVPGLIEWPARIPRPLQVRDRVCTTDLLPTLAAIIGQPRPPPPLDGIDLTPAFRGETLQRRTPLAFWEFDTAHLNPEKLLPYIDPTLQQGTTPLVKRMRGKVTRDFVNFRHPPISAADFRGPRSVIEEDSKLVLHERKDGSVNVELFDLKTDPAEQTNLAEQQPQRVEDLQRKLRSWQDSVLRSLTGADYPN